MSDRPSPSGIVICIATRDRPVGLRRLLEAIVDLEPPRLPVRVVVVDNGSKESVAPIVEEFGDRLSIEFVEEPRLGIPFARNAALDRLSDSELMTCTDDDCVPPSRWLVDLLDLLESTGADAVGGRANFLEPAGCRRWVYDVGFPKGRGVDGVAVEYLQTNNSMFRVHSLRSRNLRFDERFPLLGGEDSWLSNQLARSGGALRWSSKVLVDEHLPVERVSVRWLVRRRFRYGYGGTLRRLRERGLGVWGVEASRVAVRLMRAAVLSISSLILGRRMALRALLRAAMAAGSLWAMVGGRFDDYRVTDGA